MTSRFLVALVAISSGLLLRAETATPAPLPGWEFVSPTPTALASVCQPAADGALLLAGQPVGYLQTPAEHSDYRLHVEWRWTAEPGNAGVLVHIATGPIDRGIWPRCLQIQTKHGRVGDLLPMAGATFAESLSTPPDAKTPQLNHTAADSEKPAGEWNTCDIVCRAGTLEVTINGVLQNRVTQVSPASGRIGLQFEGKPYEVRALRIEPLAP